MENRGTAELIDNSTQAVFVRPQYRVDYSSHHYGYDSNPGSVRETYQKGAQRLGLKPLQGGTWLVADGLQYTFEGTQAERRVQAVPDSDQGGTYPLPLAGEKILSQDERHSYYNDDGGISYRAENIGRFDFREGMLTLVANTGELLVGRDTPENRAILEDAGYSRGDLWMPFAEGRRLVDPLAKLQLAAILQGSQVPEKLEDLTTYAEIEVGADTHVGYARTTNKDMKSMYLHTKPRENEEFKPEWKEDLAKGDILIVGEGINNQFLDKVLNGYLDLSVGNTQDNIQQALDQAEEANQIPGLTIAAIQGRDLYFKTIGDTRIYLLRGRDFTPLTEKDSTEGPTQLEVGDRILLCTDGLWKPVEEASLAQRLESSSKAQEASQRLILEALDAGGPDNATAVSIFIQDFKQI